MSAACPADDGISMHIISVVSDNHRDKTRNLPGTQQHPQSPSNDPSDDHETAAFNKRQGQQHQTGSSPSVDSTRDVTSPPPSRFHDVAKGVMGQQRASTRASAQKMQTILKGYDEENPHVHLEDSEDIPLQQEQKSAEDCTRLLDAIIDIMVRARSPCFIAI